MGANKQSRNAHCGSPSARELASYYFGDEGDDAASAILAGLETEHSLLAGCFRSFLQEAGIQTSHALQNQPPQQQPQQQQAAHSKRPRQKLPDTELALQVTLEELYTGAVKCVPVQRHKRDGLGHTVQVQEQLQVCVQPGVKQGTRITLPGFGNEDRQGNLSDLTFVVQQQLHPAFRRLADDLYAIVNVPLVTALTGGPVTLRTLGGQLLQLPVGDDVITPGSELVLPNQGMPVFRDAAGRRGALHVRFNVSFPGRLSRQQQLLLRHTLQGCEFNTSPQQQRVQRPCLLAPADGATAAPAASQQQQQQQQHEVLVHVHQQGPQQTHHHHQQQQQQKSLHMHWRFADSASASSSGARAAAAPTSTARAAGHTAAAAAAGRMKCHATAAAAGSSTSGSAGSSTVAGFACLHSTSSSRVS
ncbi:hypothetical protein COO60DRAFT_249400 [Scenedesmus sp. NREL 46B-D3]|nr:hypothetical protein COO60DRAFT_249400 [Scenedesmus sp. NREL 46B-D3]